MIADATHTDRRKILISAYACEPGKGSEPAAGWLWSLAAAKEHDVWVLTRANNKPVIDANSDGVSRRLHFVYVDVPSWLGFWKRTGRGIRVYYILWQLVAMRECRRLHARERFDVVHHVTFANIWLPALTCVIDAPFVFGPVGGGQRVAGAHYRFLGLQGIATELGLLAIRRINRLNPLVRLAWRRASVILLNNQETRAVLPRAMRSKTVLRPHQSVEGLRPSVAASHELLTSVFVGRLHRFKGVELAIRALEFAPCWQLVVIGDGPESSRLRRLTRRKRLESRVEFLGRLPQHQVWEEMAKCDAFVFPTLKEGGGFAALEAATLGLPVVAFDQGGPAALARFFDEAQFELVRPADAAEGIAEALRRLGKRTEHPRRIEAGVAAIATDLARIYGHVMADERQCRLSQTSEGAGMDSRKGIGPNQRLPT